MLEAARPGESGPSQCPETSILWYPKTIPSDPESQDLQNDVVRIEMVGTNGISQEQTVTLMSIVFSSTPWPPTRKDHSPQITDEKAEAQWSYEIIS